MLEYIISPQTAKKNPWDMLILGIIITSLAIWLGYYASGFLGVSASILILAIIVISLAPLMHRVLSLEEEEEEEAAHCKPKSWLCESSGFITRHSDAMALYSFLFVGILISASFWFVFLPADGDGMIPTSGNVFGDQLRAIEGRVEAIEEIEGMHIPEPDASGQLTAGEVNEGRARMFQVLYENNIRVMMMCFIASFLFGAGALWIIAWNASVVAVFIGEKIRNELANLPALQAYFMGFPTYSLGLALWGIPEIAAYLVAGLAGGIISVAVAKHQFKSDEFWFTVFDGSLLLLLAISLIFVGAWIEHFFVPF